VKAIFLRVGTLSVTAVGCVDGRGIVPGLSRCQGSFFTR
jgi:hypothetical protein